MVKAIQILSVLLNPLTRKRLFAPILGQIHTWDSIGMSPKINSRSNSRTYARIYCTPEERERWTRYARDSRYETFSDFARTAIELLIGNPDLPSIVVVEEVRELPNGLNIEEIMHILAEIDTKARA
jgi:hypothetical protein